MSRRIKQMWMKGAAHQPNTKTLILENVYMAYPSVEQRKSDRWALENITFQAKAGEQIAVIGPNGAGKSTLFNLIIGVLKPDMGQIRMFGHAPESHNCIAYVPQRNTIDWSFPVTVEDVVMMGRTRQIGLFRRPRKRDWDAVHHCLERVSILSLAKRQIGELSGGQQQRVFIARALALETNLLLMDEPLTGLDLSAQEQIFDILNSLRPDGVTVMVATHDLNLAGEWFDRVMLLNRKIVALGTGTAVLTSENLLAAYGGSVNLVSEKGQ